MIRALLLFPILILTAQPSMAIREGTATAAVFIERYTQSGDYGRLALWHEAAAECLVRISVPMTEIAHAYYTRHGYEKWAARAQKEALEIQEQYQSHLTRAETAWQKFVGEVFSADFPDSCSVLVAEHQNIAKFIATWLPRYPNRFYEFGIYPTFFRKQQELAEQEGNYAEILRLEADAADMCAAQYQQIPIAYGLRGYEKHRDAYRQYATHLRKLPQQNPNALPPEIDRGRRISDSLGIQTVPSQQKTNTILQIAKSDTRVKTALVGRRAVHAYPTFQGFAWIVSFSNHSRGHLATAIIDAKTMKVLDVCIPSKSGL
ncbi:hypothetical protein J4G07_07365 [Candidatus Poribacteria bacterium]|nr:hypothetical protein [Candidatus Poribacteria bacterium]